MRDVMAAADMVEVVSGRTPLRRASGSRFTGRCPFHEEKTPSFSVNPVDKLYYCFGCGKGGDIIAFVRETENLDFVGSDRVARRAVPRPDRVRGGVAAGRGGAPAARAPLRRARPDRRVLRAAALGRRGGRAGARVPRGARARRGDREGVPARALAGQGPRREGEGARLHARRAASPPGSSRRAARDYFPQRLMFPLADARGPRARVPGAQAARRRSAAREVRELARGRPLPQGLDPVRAPSRQDGDRRSRTSRPWSRGTRT